MYFISWIWVREEKGLINMGGELSLTKEMGLVCMQI